MVPAFCLSASALLGGRTAHAHDPFETTTQVEMGPERLSVTLTMARATAVELADALGGEHPAALPCELSGRQLWKVSSAGRPLEPIAITLPVECGAEADGAGRRESEGSKREAEGGHAGDGDVVYRVDYQAPRPGTLRVEATHLSTLGEGYTGPIQVTERRSQEALAAKVLHEGDSAVEIQVGPRDGQEGSARRRGAASPRAFDGPGAWSTFGSFFEAGLHHVLIGYDHLLFLAGVLLACQELRRVVAVLSTFTVAHALALGAVASRTVPANLPWVEPLIALSIAVAAIWHTRLSGSRLLLPITFSFGLIHGLGLASAFGLAEGGGPMSTLGFASFNLGVEAAQIVVAGILAPALRSARRRRHGDRLLTWLANAVGAFGLGLFVWRCASLT